MNQAVYIFNKAADRQELDRLKLIERYHDPLTRQRLRHIGLAPKWKCLEVGPGAGSILRWMARRVGLQGRVTAVELNPRFLTNRTPENITLIHGDIGQVQLPLNSLHMAHARFTFIHTPAYKIAIKRIFNALRPGGWLVLEEPDFSIARVVAGSKGMGQSVQRVNNAIEHMFTNAGLDSALGTTLPGVLQGTGFVNLTVENMTPIVQGGSHMATIMKWSAHQLAEKYLATGQATKTDLTRYSRFADNPSCWAIYHATVSTMAQKPQTTSRQS